MASTSDQAADPTTDRAVTGPDDPSGGEMTETQSPEAILEAVALIDQGLGQFSERNIVTSGEVADLLLDVRRLLTSLEQVSTN